MSKTNETPLTETEATVLRALLVKLANTLPNEYENKIAEVMNLAYCGDDAVVGRGTFRRTVFLLEVLSKTSVSGCDIGTIAEKGTNGGFSIQMTEIVNQKVPKNTIEFLLKNQSSDPSFADVMD